jgi:endonuclease YncB( thermonuclease family)
LKNKRVEFIPTDEWQIHEGRKIPKCSGKLLIDGTDFGEQLISMGLAQKS